MRKNETGEMGKGEQIRTETERLLKSAGPAGMKRGEIENRVRGRYPTFSHNTINGNVHKYLDDGKRAGLVIDMRAEGKKAFFRLANPDASSEKPAALEVSAKTDAKQKGQNETAYYEPFRQWLVSKDKKVTRATVVGGKISNQKWGTPDVVAIIAYKRGKDYLEFPSQIIAVEIKDATGKNNYLDALGQAVAYRLFAHRTYVVVPKPIGKPESENFSRLESLCVLYGIGLLTIDKSQPTSPDVFQPRVPAQITAPDVAYMQEFINDLGEDLRKELGL